MHLLTAANIRFFSKRCYRWPNDTNNKS